MQRIRLYTIATFCFVFTSCRTLKGKQQYYLKHFDVIVNKYGLKLGKLTKTTLPKDYKVPTMRQTKSFLAFAEHNMALWPDSVKIYESMEASTDQKGKGSLKTISGTYVCDSFYTNLAKIEYIKKYHLESPHKHFLYKTRK
jgi:hypothetical protein